MKPCWAVDCDQGPLLACDSEAEAIESQQICEYELGYVSVVHRPELPLPEEEVERRFRELLPFLDDDD